jgi:3-dehydroquinate synthase II
MGHRVCVDTLSLFTAGQGLLTGNSAAFTFLVNAETERNEYVTSRPFRINAGAVHAYALLPGDRTAYLAELRVGGEVLITDYEGACRTAVVGRIKVERRPMLLVRARAGDAEGSVFLQNAETIRLVRPGGKPVSVVALVPGDTVLCRLDEAGRHFGLRIKETIKEE